jgi:hypothetical protein
MRLLRRPRAKMFQNLHQSAHGADQSGFQP